MDLTGGSKPDPTVNMPKAGQNMMSEKTRLGTPQLDYRTLQMGLMSKLAKSRAPEGKYSALLEYLRQRTGGAVPLDAAEVDRRIRTWFEDIITEILKNPAAWDAVQQLQGNALMDYLAGAKAPTGKPPVTPPIEEGPAK